jgi:hypothetical protein
MSFDEYQNLARLHVLGALDADEEAAFQEGRREFGEEAERFLHECERLASAFALSLAPQAPPPDARKDLLARIQATAPERPRRRWFH